MRLEETAVFYYNYGRSQADPPPNIAEPLIMLAGRLSGSLFYSDLYNCFNNANSSKSVHS